MKYALMIAAVLATAAAQAAERSVADCATAGLAVQTILEGKAAGIPLQDMPRLFRDAFPRWIHADGQRMINEVYAADTSHLDPYQQGKKLAHRCVDELE